MNIITKMFHKKHKWKVVKTSSKKNIERDVKLLLAVRNIPFPSKKESLNFKEQDFNEILQNRECTICCKKEQEIDEYIKYYYRKLGYEHYKK